MKIIMNTAHEIRRGADLKVSYKEQMSICLKLSWKVCREDNFSIEDAINSITVDTTPAVNTPITASAHSIEMDTYIPVPQADSLEMPDYDPTPAEDNTIEETVAPAPTEDDDIEPIGNVIYLKYNNGNKFCSVIHINNGQENVLMKFKCSSEALAHRTFAVEAKKIIKEKKDITIRLSAEGIANIQKSPILKRDVVRNKIALEEIAI